MTGEDFERRYAGAIRWTLRRSGVAYDLAHDACQDVFLKFRRWEERYRRTHPDGVLPRVATVVKWAKRVYWSQLQKQQRQARFIADCRSLAHSQRRQGVPMLFVGSYKTDPARMMEETEGLTLVRSAVDKLPSTLQAVVKARGEGLSYEQIAQTLDISVTAAKVRFLRARKALLKMLQAHFRN